MVEEQHVGWVITKEHGEGESSRRVGYGQSMEEANETMKSFANAVGRMIYMQRGLQKDAIPDDKSVKWRSFSDDGDPCYDGVVHINWLYPEEPSGDEDPAYNIDQFCMSDAGAVRVVYNKADIRRCRPEMAEYVAMHPQIPAKSVLIKEGGLTIDSWIEIYG